MCQAVLPSQTCCNMSCDQVSCHRNDPFLVTGEGGGGGYLVELIGLQNLLLEDAVCKIGLAVGWLRELGHDQLGIPTGLLQGQGWPLACHAPLDMAPIKLAACKLLPQPKLHQHLQHQRQPNSACLTLLTLSLSDPTHTQPV